MGIVYCVKLVFNRRICLRVCASEYCRFKYLVSCLKYTIISDILIVY